MVGEFLSGMLSSGMVLLLAPASEHLVQAHLLPTDLR